MEEETFISPRCAVYVYVYYRLEMRPDSAWATQGPVPTPMAQARAARVLDCTAAAQKLLRGCKMETTTHTHCALTTTHTHCALTTTHTHGALTQNVHCNAQRAQWLIQ